MSSVSSTDVGRRFHVYLLIVRQAFSFFEKIKRKKKIKRHMSQAFFICVL